MNDQLLDLRDQFRGGSLPKADFIERMHGRHAQLFEYAHLLDDSEISAIEITAGQVVMTSRDGVKFIIDPADRRVAPVEAINFGTYEDADAGLLHSLFAPEQVVLDVGANIGWYALHVAGRFPTSTIHAFEPIPPTFEQLRQNVALNDASNVVLHDFGLSERDATLDFFFYPEGSGGASLADNSGRPSVRPVAARVRRLDDLNLAPDVIKIDVEGAELLAFRGGIETLRTHRPAVFCEMLRKWTAKFGYHPNEIIGLFTELGYRCLYLDGTRLRHLASMGDEVTATNFLFLHEVRHADRLAEVISG